MLLINYQVMKKNRKVGAATASNFFTSQFKLKPAQPSKQIHHRKLNTTFNSFKQQLFQQQTKRKTRQDSKDKKPHIEQLKFLHHKEDNFKIPQSITKRSLSKAKDESHLKIQKKNQIYQHYQEIPVAKGQIDKQKQISNMTQALKSKRFNPKDALKQKLEKAALQKFNQTILKQNQQNQNVVSEKNAQSLYLLLKTARMNQTKQKNIHFKSSPSENQQEHHQLQHQQIDKSQPNLKQKLRKQSQKITQQDNQSNKNNDKDIPKNKQTLFKIFQQNQKKSPYSFVPKPTPKPSMPTQLAKKDVIQPKEVICSESEREKFSQTQKQSQSQSLSDSFDLKQQSSIVPNKSKESNYQPPKEDIKNKDQQILTNVRKDSTHSNARKQSTQKKLEILLPIQSKNSLEPKRQSIKQQKKNHEEFLNIPNAATVDKQPTKKIIENLQKKLSVSRQSQFLNLNNNSIQKVLTPKSFEGQKHFGKQAAPKAADLPKIKADLNSKVKASYTSYGEDDSEIEEIDLKGKKASQKEVKQKIQNPILPSKKPQPNKPQKPKTQQIKNNKTSLPPNEKIKEKPLQNKNEKIQLPKNVTQPIQTNKQQKKNEQQQQQQDEQQDLYDQLAYYIERIEDIGHYRMSSKNIYKDISVSVQLMKFHKICAYYMAHQFLYLSKRSCNNFKSQTLDNDFYDITSEQLKQMRQNGILDDQIANLQSHIQQSKVLLKKCYDECKMYLTNEEQILILDGKSNYHIKCCATLIKQFKKVYELFEKNKSNTVIAKRCVYLIELYSSLKLLNGEFIKQHQEFEEIQNPIEHIEIHKSLLTS